MKGRPTSQRRPSRLVEIGLFLLILGLAAYLRLANLETNPAWYTDEGTHLDIAQNVLQGRVRYLAIDRSTLLFAKLPLFDLLLAGLLRAYPQGMGTLRALSGTLGVLSVGGLFLVVRYVRRRADPWPALLAALMLAIHPQAVLYSRWGFSYNLLAPLVLVTFLGLTEYWGVDPPPDSSRRGWLALAALAVGVGGVSDLWMFVLVLPMVLIVAARRWRDLLWSLPLAAVPFGFYAGWMLISVPQAFLFDLHFTLFRLGKLSPLEQLNGLALNYATLTLQDGWMALGLVGLFVLRPRQLRHVSLLLFLLPIAILGRTTALFSLGAYYLIPLLPLACLGLATLLRYGGPAAVRSIHRGLDLLSGNRVDDRWSLLGALLIVLPVMALPFATSARLTLAQVHQGFHTGIDPFLIDPHAARQVARFVNAEIDPGELVLVSPALAWLIVGDTADLQMAVASTGQATPDLPGDIPADRFAFDPHYERARFVVVDNLWYNWGVWTVPGTSQVLETVETWPLVFEAGQIRVYANPAIR